MAEGDPLRLARMTVLLPTRRATRALREAFLRLSGEEGGTGAPLLLPRLRPIGDLEADEVALGISEGADDPTLAIPPAIPELRRRLLLPRQAMLWRQTPPREPVIAAGLVGGFPALDELLGVIAGLERGAVILPGLDRAGGAELWETIADDPAHPQHLMARLLQSLDLSRGDVRDWPPSPSPPTPSVRDRRVRLFAEALRPAVMTDGWRSLGPEPPDTLAG